MKVLRAFCAYLMFACTAQAGEAPKPHVDLVLVLALDASASMVKKRWDIQTAGYVAAFKSEEVLYAIRSGRHRAIAVTVVIWSSFNEQKQVGEWHVIHDKQSATDFAAMISDMERPFIGMKTNIAAAIDFSTQLVLGSGYWASYGAPRRVIDISGDGVQNEVVPQRGGAQAYGPEAVDDLWSVREDAVKQGITINGLPIRAMPGDLIDAYYRSQVIAGPESFAVTVENPDDVKVFAQAISRKLILEIASLGAQRRGG